MAQQFQTWIQLSREWRSVSRSCTSTATARVMFSIMAAYSYRVSECQFYGGWKIVHWWHHQPELVCLIHCYCKVYINWWENIVIARGTERVHKSACRSWTDPDIRYLLLNCFRYSLPAVDLFQIFATCCWTAPDIRYVLLNCCRYSLRAVELLQIFATCCASRVKRELSRWLPHPSSTTFTTLAAPA